jgi:DEAD/DEAH box helicase
MRQSGEMRPYQQRIATHLYENNEALCVLRPGGGKTVAALTAIRELIDHGVIRHALIVAPKRVARIVWPEEIDEWDHVAALRFKVLDGGPEMRLDDLATAPQRDLTIVGLDVAQWLMDQIVMFAPDDPLFDLLVIDEISRLRDPTGERAKAIAKHAARWGMVWGLTGTLRPGGPENMFMPARIVTRGKLWGRSFYQWRKERFYPLDYKGYQWAPLPGAEDRINAEIAPLITTAAEGELIQPEPTIVFDHVELPPKARAQYDDMESDLSTKPDDEGVIHATNAAVATGKLAQIANGFVYDEDTKPHHVHNAKRDWLEDLVANASEPLLLIYEYREDLELLRQTIGEDLPYLGAGVSDRRAAENITDWNTGRLPFLALHPASGGHGLNLQFGGADMAWIAPCWSPEFWEQTIARLNRSGQARQVIVRVCVAARTVDEMKINRVYCKMTAQEAFEQYLRDRQAMAAA